jgi:hypothetical protein
VRKILEERIKIEEREREGKRKRGKERERRFIDRVGGMHCGSDWLFSR